MIPSPVNVSPRQKSSWKEKLKRISSSQSIKSNSGYAALRTPRTNGPPSYSNSPTLTPGSIRHLKPEEDLFLTPLDVLDHENAVKNLLDNQVGMVFGDWSIPPPPPRKSASSSSSKLHLLPSSTISGPTVKPYFAASSRSETNKNSQICFICKDVLETKLDSEKLVSLQCGDCVHGECLKANIEMLLEKGLEQGSFRRHSSESYVLSRVLPQCGGACCSENGSRNIAKPMASDTVEDITAEVMLAVKMATFSKDSQQEKFLTSEQLVYGMENRVSRFFIKDNQLLRPKSSRFSQYSLSFLSEKQDFGAALELWDVEASSSTQLLEEVKNHFIRRMISRYANFNLVVLVSLGSLRLVDRLQVAMGAETFCPIVVYLFSNFLVLETDGSYPSLIPLNGEFTIATPDTSVIQIIVKGGDIPTLRLHSEIDSVIEKWGIALSDFLLLLPTDVFTSTIDISDIAVSQLKRATRLLYELKNFNDTASISTGKFDPRISMVLSIEPREIWSDRPSNFEEELRKIGIVPYPEPLTNLYENKPTSPLNIIKAQRQDFHLRSFQPDFSDVDSDSDSELINEVMLKHKLAV